MRRKLMLKKYSAEEWIVTKILEIGLLLFSITVVAPTPNWMKPPFIPNLVSILVIGVIILLFLLLKYLKDVFSLSSSLTDALRSVIRNSKPYHMEINVGVVIASVGVLFGVINTGYDIIFSLMLVHLFLGNLVESCLRTVMQKSNTSLPTKALSAEEVSDMSSSDWEEFEEL